MPIQPFIFVGVGGTGGKTLGVIRKTLSDTLSRIGWDEDSPEGWQFVHIDVPADPDADAGEMPYLLPRTSYVPLTTGSKHLPRLPRRHHSGTRPVGSRRRRSIPGMGLLAS